MKGRKMLTDEMIQKEIENRRAVEDVLSNKRSLGDIEISDTEFQAFLNANSTTITLLQRMKEQSPHRSITEESD